MFCHIPSSFLHHLSVADVPPRIEDHSSKIGQAVEGVFANPAVPSVSPTPKKTEAEHFQNLLTLINEDLKPYSFFDSLLNLKSQGANFHDLNLAGNAQLQNRQLLALLQVWKDDIQTINLSGCEQISIDLNNFAVLPNLGKLILQDTSIVGHISSLNPLKKLWYLSLDCTCVEGDTFSYNISSLIFIRWSGKKIKSRAIKMPANPLGLLVRIPTPTSEELARGITRPVSVHFSPTSNLYPIREESSLLKAFPK